MINFDEIITDINKLQGINLAIVLQAVNFLLMEYANPLLFTISATGSAAYIWLKIKKEFFSRDKKEK
jgi:hypothetical protein